MPDEDPMRIQLRMQPPQDSGVVVQLFNSLHYICYIVNIQSHLSRKHWEWKILLVKIFNSCFFSLLVW